MKFVEMALHRRCTSVRDAMVGPGYAGGWSVGRSVGVQTLRPMLLFSGCRR